MNQTYDHILKQGLIKVNQNEFAKSKKFFEELINLNSKRYEGYLNLSNILVLEEKLKEANNLLEYYLTKIEPNSEIVNGLAINLFNSKSYNELIHHINSYIEKYDNHLLNYLKGYYLDYKSETLEAISFLNKSIILNNNFWPAYESLFYIYDRKNKLSDAEKLIEKSKQIFSKNYKFKYFEALFNFKLSKLSIVSEIIKSNELYEYFNKKENQTYLADYYNLCSKYYEKKLQYNKCIDYAVKRNKVYIGLENNKSFKKEVLLETIDSYNKFFDKKNKQFYQSKSTGLDHSNLIFLIGFPRSGTTLLDSILRSHSKTTVIEEQPYLLNIRHDFFKKNNLSKLMNLDEKEKIKIQEKYFSSFNYKKNKTTIDKFPLNLLELGFIKTIFPNSKIILAIRHPLDCILSCVLTAFKINEAMLNFENLETTTIFYNKTFKLLNKYIDFFNITYHQVKYEDVVSDFNTQINKILKYINLQFEESLNNFYKTAQKREKINTPSYDQVIKPLYSNSINRHLNFEDVKKIYPEVEKWIKFYSY